MPARPLKVLADGVLLANTVRAEGEVELVERVPSFDDSWDEILYPANLETLFVHRAPLVHLQVCPEGQQHLDIPSQLSP